MLCYCFLFHFFHARRAGRCRPDFFLFKFLLTYPLFNVSTSDAVPVKYLLFFSHSQTSPCSLCFLFHLLLSSSDLRTLRCSSAATNKPDHSASKKDLVSFLPPAALKLLRTLTCPLKQRPPQWLYGRKRAKLTWPGTFFFFNTLLHFEKNICSCSHVHGWLFFSWGTEKTVGGVLSCYTFYSCKALGISPRPCSTATLLLASPDEFYFCLQQDKL